MTRAVPEKHIINFFWPNLVTLNFGHVLNFIYLVCLGNLSVSFLTI